MNQSHRPALAASLCALALAGCSPYGSSFLSGNLPTAYFYDDEPNDSSNHPQPIGPVYAPEQLVISGNVGSLFGLGFDTSDSYALQSSAPARIHFELECYSDADLDLCLYDPYYDEVVAHWDSFGDEFGSFDIPGFGQDFQLIVVAFNGTGDYDLFLRVEDLPGFAPVPVAFTIADGERNSGTAAFTDAERDAPTLERRRRIAELIAAPLRVEALELERLRRGAAARNAIDGFLAGTRTASVLDSDFDLER